MNDQRKPSFLVPALIGGVAAGVLSGIPLLGCLCCLWIIGGAMLASHLAAREMPVSMTAGDGAIVGALAGIVAAVVDTLISIPFQALNLELMRRLMDRIAEYSSRLPGNWREMLQQRMNENTTLPWFLFGLVISAAIFAALGALGGIIGASLFGKKPAPPAAPPSPEGGTNAPQNPSHS
jgi:hypothetical protein